MGYKTLPMSPAHGVIRTFDGRNYSLYKMSSTKVGANSIKKSLQKQGRYVRVLKYRGQYAIFVN